MQNLPASVSKKFADRKTMLRVGAGCLLMASLLTAPTAQAQFGMGSSGGRPRISGSVLIDGEAQPAARVRVDVRALAGGQIATTFTDASGRFEAAAANNGSYLVVVTEQGYEPVEQRIDAGLEGTASGLIITLRKIRSYLPSRKGYTVSVHDLRVPGKAKRAYEKGLERLQKRDFEASLNHFKEATSAFPDYYEAYYQVGLADMELRRRDEAEEALQRSIDLSGGGYADPQFALGALLCDRQSYTEAERVLRRGIDVDKNSWKGHLFLGQTLFGMNRLNEAEQSARQALLRNSQVPAAYILLANIYMKRNEYVMATQYLDIFLKMEPQGSTSEQARAVRAAATRIVTRLQSQNTAIPPQFVY
jgi:tetratricopeptide (TPR) repeat protein